MRPTWFRFCQIGITPLFVIGAASALKAQAIRVGPNVAVTSGLDQRPPVEAHLAIHPNSPRHFLGAAITSVVAETVDETDAQQSCSAFVSLDDGQSWTRHEFQLTECYDPWVAITPDGRAVFTALASHELLPDQPQGLVVFHSDDGGVTWSEQPIGLGRGHDHQTVATDWNSPERVGWLFVVSSRGINAENGARAYVVYVARSRDGGKTFDAPVYVRPNNLMHKAETPLVLQDGTLVVSFVEVALGDGRSELLRRRAWVVRSTDGGHTFSMPTFVNETCGPPFRLSMLAADTSHGPFQNRLYFACNLPGTSGVVVTHSREDGDLWSAAVQVHSAPVDTTVPRKVMALAVNKDGVVGVAWVDGRNGARGECYDVYFAASLDGGDTFLSEERVSETVSCPDRAVNGNIARFTSGGDYLGMATDADGRFRLLWSDARNGPFQLWTAWVEVEVRLEGALEMGTRLVNPFIS